MPSTAKLKGTDMDQHVWNEDCLMEDHLPEEGE